jgi:mitotic spindle assembly checkpoint protein MAD1
MAGPSASAQEIAALKAEVEALKYKISSSAQEEEMAGLRREAEMREVRRKGEEDFKKMQLADGERKRAERALEEARREVVEIREGMGEERARLERRVREAEEGRRVAVEEGEEGRAEMEERVRGLERRMEEEKSRSATMQRGLQELQQDVENKDVALQEVQQRLQRKDAEIGGLEAEVLRLKAQTGDVDTLEIIKRELSEQVSHIRTLEASNREQARELKHLRMLHKSVEVVEEEKRQLQRKVDQIEDLRQELGEARLQRQRLEDERLAWTAYLKSQSGDNETVEFDSPEALARTLVQERLEAATLLEKLGRLEPALSERDEIIKTLESEKSALQTQLEKAKTEGGGGGDVKARLRLERQRTLALKEVEYLRAQVKALDTEESTMELASFDAAKAERITQLEEMVAAYSTEVQTLQAELAASSSPSKPDVSLKRAREEPEAHERLGELTRKNRKLQDELAAVQNSAQLLQKELSVAKEQLKAAKSHRQTRILTLRDNPTSNAEAVKMSTLQALREENAALLAQLTTGAPTGRGERAKVVPIQTLEAAQRDTREMERLVASTRKSMDRLKQVWGAKTAEFREGISSLLGWTVEFLPNGKMKVSSLFYPSTEEEERSIVFDGERGTMKVSGGPRSAFAGKIAEAIGFWVRERGEIPCLLAALTLEFYEESTRAAGGE